MSGKVSVIMSTYKEPSEYVQLSVNSILNQTYRDLQIIIVSDYPDNREVNEYIAQTAKKDARVRAVFNDENRGLVYSLNRALEFVEGDYIARMDADDISCNERIEKQLSFLDQNKLDIVGCNITQIDSTGKIIEKSSAYPETDKQIKKYLKYRDCIPHPSWLVKKEVYAALDGYRNIIACEDFDFLVRAAVKGFKFGNFAEPLLNYRINPTGITSTRQAAQTVSRDYLRHYYRKGKIPSEEHYKEYINSHAWTKKTAAIERYCCLKEKYDGFSNKKILKCIYGSYMFFTSSAARNVMYTKTMSEKIKSE